MPSPTRAFLRFVTVGLALASSSMAYADEPWRVARASGDVWKLSSGAPAKVSLGAVLATGESVRTGANGRLLLARGTETMLLGANTAIEISPEIHPGMTTILQQAGSLALEIDHKNEPHFEVETPYLVAAVKGTRFRVKVEPKGAQVDVTRGLVQVASLKSGQAVGVAPGQHANVGADAMRVALVGPGPHAAMEQVEARAARIEPLAIPAKGLASPFHAPRAHAASRRQPVQSAPAPAKASGATGAETPVASPASLGTDEAGHRRTIWMRGDVRRGAPDPVRDDRRD